MSSLVLPARPSRLGTLKAKIEACLRSENLERELEALDAPPKAVLNALLAFLCSGDEFLKWKSVEAVGFQMRKLADRDMESARDMLRRFMWNLNDESGGIGWGIPEAMGETMAVHAALAAEYLCILLSYVREDGNRLENPLLERGALWGLGRVAHAKPELLRDCFSCFIPYLDSPDPFHRGLGAWILGALGAGEARRSLDPLTTDSSEIRTYLHGKLWSGPVSDLAREALAALDSTAPGTGHPLREEGKEEGRPSS
ncbi:MAG TPA: hypothetical protein PLM79_02400 [Syntrophobacteraceae bacterium]|nr:hypothetical protein [Syntrophobacteraceae bacterium]